MLRLSVAPLFLVFSAAVFCSDARAPSPEKFRISGTVVNAISGQPLFKIQVSVGSAVSPAASQTITTGEDGHFQFNDLSRGKYWLLAEGRGFSAQRFDQHEQFSTAIAVGPGLSSEGLTFRLSPDATIVGTITDEQNEAVAEARVMLFRTGVQNGAASTQILNQAQTDDQGHYHLSHVPPGTYYVAVSARPWYADNRPRFAAGEFVSGRNVVGVGSETQPDPQFDVTYPITFYPGVTDPSAATALTLNQGDRLVVDLAMTAVPCVPVRLSDSSVQPNQGFNAIIAENVFGMSLPVATAVNVLGPGEVEVSGLAPGHYSINLQTFGKTPVSREQQIDVSNDSEISMANSATAPSINGTVQMEGGRPLPSTLNVRLFSRNQQNLTVQTSADGKFEMPPQFTRPGKYQVAVFGSPGIFLKSVSATGATLTGRELNVADGAAVYLKIVISQGTGQIDGTALRDGKPFAGAMIVLVPKDIEHNSLLVRRDQSDSDGTFSLYNVLPGSYSVLAIRNGWDLQWLNPDVLRPYLKSGTEVTLAARGRYDIKVHVQQGRQSARVMSKEFAISIVRTLRDRGHQAYLVGGCVRDLLLCREPADYDVASDATPQEVMRIFPDTYAVGAQFGVVLVPILENSRMAPNSSDFHSEPALADEEPALPGHSHKSCVEVATFRADISYSDGRHPDEVRFSRDPGEDVQRRDFTINGLLLDPIENKVLDFVGGQNDLKAGIIRAIGGPAFRFTEDKLRMLRAVRFAARFGYQIDRATFAAIQYLAEQIHQVSQERVRDELTRMLTEGHARRAFELLDESGLLREVLPEIAAMKGVEQPPEFHPEGDVFVHTLLMLERLPQPCPATLAWGALLHDVGKPPTFRRAPDRIRFDEHARVGTRMAEEICRRLRFSNDETAQITALVENHMRFMDVERMNPSTFKKFIRLPHFDQHLELHRLDCESSHRNLHLYEFTKEKMNELPPEAVRPAPLLTGDNLIDAGYLPGPQFKEILVAVEDAQLDGRLHSFAEAMDFVNREFPAKFKSSA